MTKKDYVAIAEIIRCTRNSAVEKDNPVMRVQGRVTTCLVAMRIADHCAGDSDKFDRGRFLTACGVGQ